MKDDLRKTSKLALLAASGTSPWEVKFIIKAKTHRILQKLTISEYTDYQENEVK